MTVEFDIPSLVAVLGAAFGIGGTWAIQLFKVNQVVRAVDSVKDLVIINSDRIKALERPRGD